MFHPLNERFAIGSVADSESLKQIAESGYCTVIDLCTPVEGNQLNPDSVERLGLTYVGLPVSLKQLSEDTVKAYTQTWESAQTPIYTRCASGKRAGLITFLALATQENWTEAQLFERIKASGLDFNSVSVLSELAQNYLRNLNAQRRFD